VTLATIMWIVDFHKSRWWTKPFVVYGVNPTIAFVGSAVMARCIYSIFKVTVDGQRISLQAGIYRTLFASWLAPLNASLAFALTFVAFWYGILYLFYRRNIILKV
jgi:predicted acyltransferase